MLLDDFSYYIKLNVNIWLKMIGAELLGYNLMQFKDYSNKNDKMIRYIDAMFLSHFNLDVNVL